MEAQHASQVLEAHSQLRSPLMTLSTIQSRLEVPGCGSKPCGAAWDGEEGAEKVFHGNPCSAR